MQTATSGTAYGLARIEPESAGLSREALVRIDRHLENRYIAPGKVAGTLTLIARGGEVAYVSPLGLMDRERERPMAEDTLFRIYSMTKPITSVALMMLYEEGHFQLGDPVHKFIPKWRESRVFGSGSHPNWISSPAETVMTVRDLLTHMSGLTYGFMERTNVDAAYRKLGIGGVDSTGDLRSLIETLADLPLEFSPGTRWNYSVSTDVVGYLVEQLSGQRLDEYLEQRILKPLGMVDTGFVVAADKVDRFAANYNRDADKRLRLFDDPADSLYTRPRTFLSGGGGLVSTVGDYLRFCQMLMNGGELGGVRLLGPKTVDLMTRNHLPDGQDLTELSVGAFSETTNEGTGFGLGFSVLVDPVKAQTIGSAGEYGWGGMASTVFWNDPREDLTVIFMTQLMPSGTFNFRGQLRSLVYPAIVG